MYKQTLPLFLCIFLSACDLIDYHPYDGRLTISERDIKTLPSLMFCLHAHNHCVSAADLFDDGIIYYGCSNIAKRNYLLFTLTPDGYTYEIINF